MKSQVLPLIQRGFTCSLICLAGLALQSQSQSTERSVLEALTFHASFDKGIEADVSKGNPSLYTISSKQPKETIRRGLHTQGQTLWKKNSGIQGGGALRFNANNAPWIFYQGEGNVRYDRQEWEGSISLWMKLDPETELAPGYADPLQLTTRAWNDAAFFVDFSKDGNPRDFRLGAFADVRVWTPDGKDIPEEKRPLLPVKTPPFGREKWTHVLFTWASFNTGDKNGVARLYMDGASRGEIKGWKQTFTWPASESVRLYLGLSYIGLIDEVSCFNRALKPEEVQWVRNHPRQLVAQARD